MAPDLMTRKIPIPCAQAWAFDGPLGRGVVAEMTAPQLRMVGSTVRTALAELMAAARRRVPLLPPQMRSQKRKNRLRPAPERQP